VSQETSTEDLTILAAIEDLERGADPSAAARPRGDETAETLARLYTEVLGLIPSGLDPVAPGGGARDRLLAAIGAAPAAEPRPLPAPAPAPVAAPPVAVAPPAAAPPRPQPRSVPGPLPRRHSRWPLALAAVLALAFLGTSVWLWQLQQGQAAEIARLRQDLATQRELAGKASSEGQEARTEMEKMRARFALVTSPAVEVRPLRPVGGQQPNARGLLFVAPDHQHWYLALEGLEPPVEGGVYKLWWMTEQGPHDGGSLAAQSGEKIQMSSDAMPAGITAVVVTLEPTPATDRPSGPEILRAAA
jgi:Anti-sigma-K factor rskA